MLAAFAIANGVQVLRREGRTLGNSLSLLAGLALVLVPAAMAVLTLHSRGRGGGLAWGLAAALFLLCSYLGVVFTGFLLYSLIYAKTTGHQDPAALVILGSRIIDGRVPPLLRARLDAALTVYERTRRNGRPALLIPSGGKGPDESRSEGEAMGEYLLSAGADPADVRPETAASTTRENLLLARDVQAEADRPGTVLAVTSNYHVLRAAVLARSIGSEAQVIGAPTARYYVPSAFLREFVAVLAQHRRLHVLLLAPFIVLTVVAFTALYTGG